MAMEAAPWLPRQNSAPTTPPWSMVRLIECVCTIRAALLRATSPFRAHCPLFWPQMANERICKAQRHTLAFDALHAITGVLEATAMPSAARERVF